MVNILNFKREYYLPQINNISNTVTIEYRQLKARWSLQLEQDLRMMHGLTFAPCFQNSRYRGEIFEKIKIFLDKFEKFVTI